MVGTPLRGALLLLTLALLSTGPTPAQSASQVTPQSFAPQVQMQGRGIVIPERVGQMAPAGAEQLTVLIGGVRIDGGLPALAQAAAKVEAELTGKTVSAAELFAATSRLQAAYAAAGYALVRVVLPAQRLIDGATLHIVVIDGFLETIYTAQLPDNIRSRVAGLLAPLIGQRQLTSAVIERQLLLAGDLPGTVLRSTLSRRASSLAAACSPSRPATSR